MVAAAAEWTAVAGTAVLAGALWAESERGRERERVWLTESDLVRCVVSRAEEHVVGQQVLPEE